MQIFEIVFVVVVECFGDFDFLVCCRNIVGGCQIGIFSSGFVVCFSSGFVVCCFIVVIEQSFGFFDYCYGFEWRQGDYCFGYYLGVQCGVENCYCFVGFFFIKQCCCCEDCVGIGCKWQVGCLDDNFGCEFVQQWFCFLEFFIVD